MGYISFIAIVLIVFWIVQIFRPTSHLLKTQSVEIEHVDVHNVDPAAEQYPYIKKQYLMSFAEYNFYKILMNIVGDKYYVVPQVALAKLVEVEKDEIYKKKYRSKIDKKSVDYVLFNKPAFSPFLIIELDDSTHLWPNRVIRDTFVDRVADKAGIKIIHIKYSKNYNIPDIQRSLAIK